MPWFVCCTRSIVVASQANGTLFFVRLPTGWRVFGNAVMCVAAAIYIETFMLKSCRYAIGNAERPTLERKIGWLDHLANATYQYYRKCWSKQGRLNQSRQNMFCRRRWQWWPNDQIGKTCLAIKNTCEVLAIIVLKIATNCCLF